MLETILRVNRKARKDHRCSYCRQVISKGVTYEYSVHKFDGHIYEWKNHFHCNEISNKLKMWDYCDEGLTDEAFCESIRIEYQQIMSDHHNELYESKEFKYPPFSEQMQFVLDHHQILTNKTT